MSSCNFAKVIAEPENDTAPTRTVKATAMTAPSSSATSGSSSRATSAAAPPPTPLNSATSCGICVIFTRREAGTAMTVPSAMTPRMSATLSSSVDRKTTTIASRAPKAPSRLPRRAVFGDDRPLRARMKQTAAIR